MNGYTAVALTKLDILDGFSEIKIGVEYRKDGQVLKHFPSAEQVLVYLFPRTKIKWQKFEKES